MDNPYLRQYPELMNGKTIMYNHGFGSAASTGTVTRIRQTFPNARVVAFDIPLHPEEAMAFLKSKVEETNPDLIIGTSMGGMYTEMLYGYDRILVNPAFQMGQTMKDHGMTGLQTWQNPRQDGEETFIVTKALEKEYKEMTEHCFEELEAMDTEQKAEEQQHVWGLFGDADPVVHTFDLFREHYPQAAHFHGEHRMDDRSFMNGVVPAIRWIDDKQEGRERPIVYIDQSTLRDHYGKPKSSLAKAFSKLIETYAVYIVVSAPTNEHDSLSSEALWIEQYLSTPAHNRVIYSNQKHLLYGDYFIDANPCENFMGTNIEFGSDEFKTWEEVITFFERLKPLS
ncbi:MAG: YqiA/YcfP family alpha/beta fold hydrolase [Prevotella sp.]|jgi:predicted esterase YcpF (UPF0227 family)